MLATRSRRERIASRLAEVASEQEALQPLLHSEDLHAGSENLRGLPGLPLWLPRRGDLNYLTSLLRLTERLVRFSRRNGPWTSL
jgi:hypothetical protein